MTNNPYAPSIGSLKARPAAGFRDLSAISRWLSILLALGAAVSFYNIIESAVQLRLGSSEAAYTDPGLGEALMAVLQTLLFLSTAITFLRWIYLAHKNLPEIGARYLRCSAGWAVGSYFIPVVSLWAPFQAMRDLAKASRNPARWDLEDTPAVIVAWWPLWLMTQLLDNVSLRLLLSPGVPPQLIAGENLLEGVVSLPLYLVARRIVRRVWRDQAHWQQAAAVPE